ncbi:MAG: 4-vinyl reductase [Chloroflexi bacterium]|nr:4-vinyl reductase [Chloroflexota bacterium]
MSDESLFYPPKMGKIMLLGMEEIMGGNGVGALLELPLLGNSVPHPLSASSNHAFSFETISSLQSALELIYGPHGGRGMALRIGRACFKYGLKEYGSLLGLTEMTFRLLSLPVKFHIGAKAFADLFNKHTDQRVRVEEREDEILWHIERCPLCWERKAEEPVCHLAVGLLQESLSWLSGGKIFDVKETACIARGDAACTIAIDRTPLS